MYFTLTPEARPGSPPPELVRSQHSKQVARLHPVQQHEKAICAVNDEYTLKPNTSCSCSAAVMCARHHARTGNGTRNRMPARHIRSPRRPACCFKTASTTGTASSTVSSRSTSASVIHKGELVIMDGILSILSIHVSTYCLTAIIPSQLRGTCVISISSKVCRTPDCSAALALSSGTPGSVPSMKS